ncbi:protein of unassigned function [Methylobacterium oryzae CBMB20]|uniref:Protein of unassigned function n=1 Tax=Methylobacterium oryzae CBMB20 TaxID=693986 RepID=A0A089NYR4_9HYPH|nr:protein of unassigned function [Methylobacterium oryzae CBMB20]
MKALSDSQEARGVSIYCWFEGPAASGIDVLRICRRSGMMRIALTVDAG